MSISFPDNVLVLMQGFQEKPSDIALRTEMDKGVAKQRRKQTDVIITVPLTLVFLTADIAASFETWFYHDAGAGMVWFDWLDPRVNVLRSARCVANTLGALAPYGDVAQFKVTSRTISIEYKVTP